MKKISVLPPSVVLLNLALIIVSTSIALSKPLVTIETVEVGDAGNAPSFGQWKNPNITNGIGGVDHVYRIGKFEITLGQYTTFLNSVAKSDPYGLYNTNMAGFSSQEVRTNGGLTQGFVTRHAGIARTGAPGGYKYRVIGPFGKIQIPQATPSNRPVSFVSWFDAARFVNWLHNGATNGADTENGAYSLNGATNGNAPARNLDAKWWIPTEDEWFKAGHYKGGGTNSGFWLFPTQSDELPGNHLGNLTNQANIPGEAGEPPARLYFRTYAVTQPEVWYFSEIPFSQNLLTDVGAFSNSPSAYGTFDQAGNVEEWNDLTGTYAASVHGTLVSLRGLIGGSIWTGLRFSIYPGPETETLLTGFRVAASASTELVAPALILEEPVGKPVTSNARAKFFGNWLSGTTSTGQVYTIRNAGSGPLTSIALLKLGSHTNDFIIKGPVTNELAPGASTTFSVSFAPATGGTRTAQISISSNDTNRSPFLINLSGFGIGFNVDSDKDGLSDAAEFLLKMHASSFDWQAKQPELVGMLLSNVNPAGFFTKAQYDAFGAQQFTAGRTAVTANPTAFNLVLRTNIPPVRIAMPKNAPFTANIGGSWTHYAQSGVPGGWSFNTNTGMINGLTPTSGERSVRIIPYNGSQAGPQMTIQLRPAP